MKKTIWGILALVLVCLMVSINNKDNDVPSSETPSTVQSAAPQSAFEDVKQTVTDASSDKVATVNLFIDEYNKVAVVPITNISEINITDSSSEHYRREFRLSAFSDAYAKTGYIGDAVIDVIGYGWLKSNIRVYINNISLAQAREIIRIASPILDTNITDNDIQKVMNYLDESPYANGFYYGDIGLVLSGKYTGAYNLMLKVE